MLLLLSSILLLTRWTTNGFALQSPPATRRSIAPAPSAVVASFQSTIVHDFDELEGLSPLQIKSLRRITSERRASKEMSTFFIPRDESEGPLSPETLSKLSNQLRAQELVQVRGVAVHDRLQVRTFVERLLLELEWLDDGGNNGSEQENNNNNNNHSRPPVYLVDLQGHCAVLYRPNGTIPLRTTLKANGWEKRPRAPRDNSGQIIVS